MLDLTYDDKGLIPAIIQDVNTKEVLMLAYMNKESIQMMIDEKKTCFYSRSRQKFWIKGESSGHVQHVKDIFIDCDKDTLLITVEQVGGACHEGYKSCFFRQCDEKIESVEVIAEKVFNPDDAYKKK